MGVTVLLYVRAVNRLFHCNARGWSASAVAPGISGCFGRDGTASKSRARAGTSNGLFMFRDRCVPRSPSVYIRKRGEATRRFGGFPDAVLIRPAVIFGPDDAFLTAIIKLLGDFQSIQCLATVRRDCSQSTVEDVGQAIAKIMQREQTGPILFECGGPRVYTYEGFLRTVASAAGMKPSCFRFPRGLGALAWIGEMLPSPPITRNQVELMRIDSASTPEYPIARSQSPRINRANTPRHTKGSLI